MSDGSSEHGTTAGTEPERRQAERRRGEQRRLERALWQGALGLLLALAALAVALLGGWRVLSVERALEADRAAAQLESHDHELLQAALARLEARGPALDSALARLEPLPARVEALDGRVGRIEARIEAPQRAVARAEAAHLVELAATELALERDPRLAAALYAAADARLAEANDAASLRIRAQLERDLAALRAVELPDLGALAHRLDLAGASVRTLPLLGAIQAQYAPRGEAPPPPGLARAWWRLTTALHDLVSVRRVSDATVRLVSMEEIGVRRHHLETLLLAARLAALRADDADYAASLAAARDWLGRFFDGKDAGVRALDAELAALAAAHVGAALPDVSGSLKLLRGKAP
ncbi:MAG: uroporphyrinogen-III C-methyltransferase [Proteobacteria bacterium]|nr:uroporphyrinogen-III C-methyltransferase [Pseudomonadota bacterium]